MVSHTQELICFKRYTQRRAQLAGKGGRAGTKVTMLHSSDHDQKGTVIEYGHKGHKKHLVHKPEKIKVWFEVQLFMWLFKWHLTRSTPTTGPYLTLWMIKNEEQYSHNVMWVYALQSDLNIVKEQLPYISQKNRNKKTNIECTAMKVCAEIECLPATVFLKWQYFH